MKKYFEYQDDKSSKFWEITIDGVTLKTRYGKIGTAGQTTEKTFANEAATQKEYNKLIKEKTSKGYVAVSNDNQEVNVSTANVKPLDFIKQNPTLGNSFSVNADDINDLEEKLGYKVPAFLKEFWLLFGARQYFNGKRTEDNENNAITNLNIFSNHNNLDISVYRFYEFFHDVFDEEKFGENFEKEKEYLDACFWVYAVMNEIVEGKLYFEFFYINALGDHDSYRGEENETITFVPLINKLVAMKPLFETFLNLFLKNKNIIDVKKAQLELDLQRKVEEEAIQKSQTKEIFLKKYGFAIKTYHETIDLLGVAKLFDTTEDNDYDDEEDNYDFFIDEEYLDQYEIYYAKNDVFIDTDFEIPEVSSYNNWNIIIVVNGNLTVRGKFAFQYYATKNATFDYLVMNNFQKSLGQEKVLYLQEQNGEDDEMIRSSIPRKVTAPYFFSWYYNLNSYDFSPETVIIALYDWDDLHKFKTTNAIFRYHDAAFALKDSLGYFPNEPYYNAIYWNTTKVYNTLKNGESIFRDGFDVSCMTFYNKGYEYLTDEIYETAFVNFKKATELSPNFYLSWYYCAFILDSKNAFEQAIPYFEQAIELSVNNKTYDYLQATLGIAFALIRTKKYTQSLPFLDNCIEQEYNLGMTFRYRGEALVMLKKSNEALQDLNTASQKYNNNHLPVLWLTGLAYYQLGKKTESNVFLEKAREQYPSAPSYEVTQLLDFYSKENVFLDWENKKLSQVKTNDKGQEHWNNYLKKHASFERIPLEFITEEMVKWFFDSSQTHYINYATFKNLPEKLKTKEIALMACVGNQNHPPFEDIPLEFIDKAFCLAAKNVELQYVPNEVLDYDICIDAVIKSYRNYRPVPKEFQDEKMAIAAIAGGALKKYSDVSLPKKYHETEFVCQAVILNFNALRNIPSKYMDTLVFETAQKQYQNHPDWQEVVNEFSFNGEYGYNTFERVWACFWSEDFIIDAIQKGDERLYNIPAKYITKKIAENAKADIINIPKELLTPEICLKAVHYEYATAFQYVPFEMRDEIISAKAVSINAYNIKLVPLQHKSVALSLVAIMKSADNLLYIPYSVHVELFDILLKKHSKDFYQEFMYFERGLGHLFTQNYTKAIEDFQLSRSKKENECTEYVPKSYYYEGFANYKLGNNEKATQLFDVAITLFKKDFPEELIDVPYEIAQLPIKQDVTQFFSPEVFGYMMQDIAKLSEGGFAKEALVEIANAEKILTESGCNDMNYWAMVWDQKRFSLYEDGQKEACYAHCTKAIEKLSKVTTWPYIAFDNNIRHALRSMHNTLAYHFFETATTLEEIKTGLEINKKSFIKAPIEDDEVLEWFYITKAELLWRATQFDEKYKDSLDKTVKKIIKLKLKKKDMLSDEFIKKHNIS
jgi:predicted DNA-binding WGR domain protein/Tfp pilus assembly protein PilF